MVKSLMYLDFINQLDAFYTATRDKNSVYLTFKRVYQENFKYKRNSKMRRARNEDRKQQASDPNTKYSVLVRAKWKKNRISTVVNYIIFKNYYGS